MMKFLAFPISIVLLALTWFFDRETGFNRKQKHYKMNPINASHHSIKLRIISAWFLFDIFT